jgi:RND family efflux transporter MFP subunit
MSTLTKLLTRVVAPVGILGLGLGCAGALVALAPKPQSQEGAEVAIAVEVVEVQPQDVSAVVQVTGTVQAAKQVGLTPEVQGRVVFVDERLAPGGRFGEGEVLLRVDARDYRAALAADEARLAQAELEVALERQRQLTADREWEIVGNSDAEEPLALRRPHLKVAESNLASAVAGVERSRLNVSRTSLRVPFNSIVVSETVDEGQVVGPGAPVVTLIGTDAVRVLVSVPVEKLARIDVPGMGGDFGSSARIIQSLGGQDRIVRTGQVTGVSGQLDPQTRTAQLVITVPDPMSGEAPLLPGSFVEVEVVGKTLPNAVSVPRVALSGADRVWVVRDDRLVASRVDIGWRSADEVFVTAGLEAGDQVLVTPISLPVEGMLVAPRLQVASTEAE